MKLITIVKTKRNRKKDSNGNRKRNDSHYDNSNNKKNNCK